MSNAASVLTPTLGSLGFSCSPLTACELPLGTLVWLSFNPVARGLAPSAGLAKELVIAETGNVPRLRVKNLAKVDVLLPSDLVVDGGKQARVVERSVIIPATLEVEVPVRCVEAGRWAGKPDASATKFSVTASASIGSREHLMSLKQASLRKGAGAYGLEQGEVWKHVADELTRTGTRSATNSYTAFLENRGERLARAKAMKIVPPSAANAVAVVRHGGAIWIEAFPSHAHAEESAIAHAADLLVEGGAAVPPESKPFADPRARAHRALERLFGASLVTVAPPEGTKGESFAVDAEGVAGFLLVAARELAHLTSTVDVR